MVALVLVLIRLLLEWILQNKVRHFMTLRQDGNDTTDHSDRYKQINDTLFRQRITAGSAAHL